MRVFSLLRIAGATIMKELIVQEWEFLFRFIAGVLKVSAFAWLARISGNIEAITFLGFGALFVMVWTGVIARGGWVMEQEVGAGTMDFVLISKAPLSVVLLSKVVASTLTNVPTGIVCTITVFLVSMVFPHIENIAVLCFAIVLGFLSIAAVGFFACVLVVLVGGRAGVFMGIVPLGTVLGGFVLPLEKMPLFVRALSSCVPSSWAMNSLWIAVSGYVDWHELVYSLLLCIGLLVVWIAVSYLLCKRAEWRIRISGNLGRQW